MAKAVEIAGVFARIGDVETMADFMDEILTEAERKKLDLRWQVLKEIHNGTPQREIASRYKMSLCKISRGSRIIKKRSSVSNKILEGKI
jgi:TrpR family transcriptional regulator, trp operon repressor